MVACGANKASAAWALLISSFNAAWVAVDMGLSISEVLSTSDNPTISLVIPPTVPVNVGLAKGANKASAAWALCASANNAAATALDTGLSISVVLSTLSNPTDSFDIPVITPVNSGLFFVTNKASAS